MILMKVLVVDDNTVAADALGSALKDSKTEVEIVYGGQDCIARAKAAPPDLIILDMNMPVVDGAKVLQEFSKWDPKPSFKVLISTAYADWESDMMEKALGGTSWGNLPQKKLLSDLVLGELDKSSGFTAMVTQAKEHLRKLHNP